jgi:very-short-patch-repair endonuclease
MRGAYLVDADRWNDPTRAEVVRAAWASCGRHAVIGLQTAAELHGIAGAISTPQVHVLTPRERGRGRRIVDNVVKVHQIDLEDGDITEINGLLVTTAARTLMDLVCCLDRFEAVAVADSCLHRGFVTEDDIAAIAARLRRRRGAIMGRDALAEADARAASSLETRVRLRAKDGKVAPDQLQYEVRRADGSLIARCDFAWTRHGLVGEADGVEPHSSPEALLYDRERQNAITATGLRIVRFTWDDTLRADTVPRAIRAAMRRPIPG